MNHDREAAWPLASLEEPPTSLPTGRTPSNRGLTLPHQSPPDHSKFSLTPANTGFTPGQRIAVLAIILTMAIPLSAIAQGSLGIIGLSVGWAGIVLVTAITMGLGFRRN
ncbi:MAG: hypothetical protein FWG15_03980 [Propionibacteriaceae bacterium]|jgi:hypothetical protein|nr:hypothetical protein [Propionibacteriaceae bacterium]